MLGTFGSSVYSDLVYKSKKIVCNFSAQFIKISSQYKKIYDNILVVQQTACLAVNPITVGNFALLFLLHAGSLTLDSVTIPT